MGHVLRTLAALFIVAPLAAMLAEPFYEAVLDHLSIDTEKLADPAVTAMFELFAAEWFRYLSLFLVGTGVGVWVHWGVTKFDRRKHATADQAKQDGLVSAQSEPQARQSESMPRQLSRHEIERKLTVIDEALDLVKEMQPILTLGDQLKDDEWVKGNIGETEFAYAERLHDFLEQLKRFSGKVENFRQENSEHPDIMKFIQSTYYSRCEQNITSYMNACREMEAAERQGIDRNDSAVRFDMFFKSYQSALFLMKQWRDTARQELGNMRIILSK